MLTIENLTYRIGGRVLLERANLALPAGHHAGLVGRNGTGKSTLLKLIAGELHADSGDITLPNGTRMGMVAQEAPAGPESLIDTVLMADRERTALLAEAEHAADPHRIADIHTRLADIEAHRAPARAATILHGLGFNAEQQQRPCRDFSGGWRMRVALAAVLFSEPDLLLLDEPTNHLDLEATLWLEDYLKRYPHTVLLVSHDRDLLNKVVDKIIHLEALKLTVYSGGYDTFEKTRALKIANIAAAQKKQEAQRAHMQASSTASATRPARPARRSRASRCWRAWSRSSRSPRSRRSSSTFRTRTSWRRPSSRSTMSKRAMSRASRCCATSICGSTWMTASRCWAPTATASRPWRSCWPAASSRCPARCASPASCASAILPSIRPTSWT